ncbi:MAG: hypothetical protein IPH82_13380 [Chloroflexi bacterium]|nr:hypothetical protein [Chloroflexota bacterium]
MNWQIALPPKPRRPKAVKTHHASSHTDTITLYTSNYCGHARRVEQF